MQSSKMISKVAPIALDDMKKAHARISPHIHKTPVLTSTTFDAMSEKQLFFKCENLQKTGSFKARGALNAILKAQEENQNLSGIVTHSSGNHGQAVAWASCQIAKLPCSVVVPKGTPAVKCDAIEGYGAELVFCDNSPTSRRETCQRIADDSGKVIVHPYDDFNVIRGQGTIAMELHEQIPNLDAILVPISGGGMTSGIALATKALNPACKVIAVEPLGKDLGPSLKTQTRLWPNPAQFINTVAEGIKTQQVGDLTFPILCDLIEDQVITVTDEQMLAGVRLVAERMKLVVEASADASVAAALISGQLEEKFPKLERVGIILCGGNIELHQLVAP